MADISYGMKRLPSAGDQPSDFVPEARGINKMSRDEADLMHFGKRQQFKVSPKIHTGNSLDLTI